MGVSAGTGVAKRVVLKRVACGLVAGALVAGMGACSSSSPHAAGDVTLQQALSDFKAGSTTLAKSEFEQVVKNDPQNKFAWYNLGVLAQYAGDSSSSSKNYTKALKIDPHMESALYNYGVLKFSNNDLDGAISYLEKAVAENNQDANAHWNLGLALAKRGKKADNKRSATQLNIALKMNPKLAESLGGGSDLSTRTTVAANSTPTVPGAAATSTTTK